jgi:hypothetical protein
MAAATLMRNLYPSQSGARVLQLLGDERIGKL